MADEGQARAGKEWLTSWEMRRMLLQQCARAAPNWKCCSRRRHETWWKDGDGEGEGGRVRGLVVTTDHFALRCGCARQVRRGGTEVTPTCSHLDPPVCRPAVRCRQPRNSSSASKQGTWACQNEGLGDLRALGGGPLGYLRLST